MKGSSISSSQQADLSAKQWDADMSQNWTHRVEIGKTGKSGSYLLLFLAPSSGVGFYETGGSIYRFDLVADEDIVLADERRKVDALRQEFDQIEVMEEFSRLEELKQFAIRHYLRDKKNTYYSLLFTVPLGKEMVSKTLALLDDRDFVSIELSEKLLPSLRERAKPDLVAETFRTARRDDRSRVLGTMTQELAELTGWGLLEEATEAVKTEPQRCEYTLWNLQEFMSRLGSLPRSLKTAFGGLIQSAEGRLANLSVPGIEALLGFGKHIDYDSLPIRFSYALAQRQSHHLEEVFTAALHGAPRQLMELASIFRQREVATNPALLDLGRACLEGIASWQVTFIGLPPRGPTFQWRPVAGSLNRMLLGRLSEIQNWLPQQPALRRSPTGIVFALEPSAFYTHLRRELMRSEHFLAETSFLLAFYADPEESYRRLSIGPASPEMFVSFYHYLDYLRRGLQLARAMRVGGHSIFIESALRLTGAANFLSVLLGSTKTYPDRELFRHMLHLLLGFLSDSPGDRQEFWEPIHVMLGNILAWAWQTGQADIFYGQDLFRNLLQSFEREKYLASPAVRLTV